MLPDYRIIFTEVNNITHRVITEIVTLVLCRLSPGRINMVEDCFQWDGPVFLTINRAGVCFRGSYCTPSI